MKGNSSRRAISKALVTLIMIIAAIAPALTTATTSDQGQQVTNLNNAARENSPGTGTYWARTYGGSLDDWAFSVNRTSDGGYIVAGGTASFGAGGYDVWVLKLSSTGGVTWQKTYGGSESDRAYSVQQTSDGGYVIAGYTMSFGAGISDFWVLKLDSAGSVTWQKTYGAAYGEYAQSIQQTSDGGYIVAGTTESSGAGLTDFWVLKLDSTGGVTWQKTYGTSKDDWAKSVQQTSDGGYVVVGYSVVFGTAEDFWVLKLDSTGGVTWQKTYGGTDIDEAYSIQQTSDGGYILAGDTWLSSPTRDNIHVIKLDSTGTVTWQKTYGGNTYDKAYSIRQTSDGGYIVAGYTGSTATDTTRDAWVLKLNSAGSVTWQKTYGSSTGDEAHCIRQTSDGGYILAGYTYGFGASGYDVWVVKLDSDGSIVWDGDSGASTQTTSVVPADSDATTTTTTATATSTSATTGVTQVTAQSTQATVRVQSSGGGTATTGTTGGTTATTGGATTTGGGTGQGVSLTIVVGVVAVAAVVVVLVAVVLMKKKKPTGIT